MIMIKNFNGFKKLHQLLLLEKPEIISIYFYAALSGLLQLSLPLGIQAIIGFVLGATMVTSIYILIFFIVLGTAFIGILRLNQMKIIEKVQQKIFVRYAFAFSNKIPNFDFKSIDKYYLPEKINRFFDTLTVQKGLSKLLIDIPISTIRIFFGLLLITLYHPLFIVFDIVVVLILIILLKFTYKSGLETSIEESNYKYKLVAWLQEMSRVVNIFRFSNGSSFSFNKTDSKLLNYINARTSHFKILLFQYKSIIVFKVLITAVLLILGNYLLFNQSLNIGEFVAIEIVIIMVIESSEKLIINLENVYDVITGLIKLDSVTEIIPEESGNLEMENTNLPIKIEFKNVHFSYDKYSTIFTDLSCEIPPNSITQILGKTGSGKSSILKLISGNYLDFRGLILINDISITNYSLENLRQKTGLLLQQQDIFDGTLYENIAVGKIEVSQNEIYNIAQEIGIEDFITDLPLAWKTKIDPLGKKLPSNLIQKILILRALVGNPKILLLEEPWLGLNDGIKTKIINYLNKIKFDKTIVVVGNDSEMQRYADYKITLENGKATEN